MKVALRVALLLLGLAPGLWAAPGVTWLQGQPGGDALAVRIPPPEGYERVPAPVGSFTAWLRALPLRPEGTVVRLFDGREKGNHAAVFAVVNIDVGTKDLQQCADAVIRLRAEYLWAAGCAADIGFNFTSGHAARWPDWSAGLRPVVARSSVSWVRRAEPDASYAAFRRYLDAVFTYAGSRSLARELESVADPSQVRAGDVFIQGGSPGHAVLVADIAERADGARMFVLLQSYMPAQDVHVLRNPDDGGTPWYRASRQGVLKTPEWIFAYTDLKRFPRDDCREVRADARR